MDQTINKIIFDDTPKVFDSDNETTSDIANYWSPTSINCAPPHFDVDYSPKEGIANEIYPTYDSLVPQPNIPVLNKDQKYRIHLGTQPGYYKEGQIKFTEKQKLHSKIIDTLENFLTSCNISYKFIKKDAFSNTDSNSKWGFEPYACILLSCSDEMAKGLAALIGLALRQDAIGIYTDNGEGFSHPVFTVSTPADSTFTKMDAILLMKEITKRCPCLSGQFDKNGRDLEFHDFENTNDTPILIGRIQTIINRYYGTENIFQITKSIGQSDLLEKKDYEYAIKQAGLGSCYALIALTRLHDYLYDKPEST